MSTISGSNSNSRWGRVDMAVVVVLVPLVLVATEVL
jgi:hypothetical protein